MGQQIGNGLPTVERNCIVKAILSKGLDYATGLLALERSCIVKERIQDDAHHAGLEYREHQGVSNMNYAKMFLDERGEDGPAPRRWMR